MGKNSTDKEMGGKGKGWRKLGWFVNGSDDIHTTVVCAGSVLCIRVVLFAIQIIILFFPADSLTGNTTLP